MESCDRNITLRRKQPKGIETHSSCNDNSLNTSSSLYLSDSAQSLPDLSRALLNHEVEELRSEIMKLKMDLERTQNEVDNLNSENHTLQQIITSQQAKMEQFKLLCKDSWNINNSSKSSVSSKKRNNLMKSRPSSVKKVVNLSESYSELNINLENTIETPVTTPIIRQSDTSKSPTMNTTQSRIIDECEVRNLPPIVSSSKSIVYKTTCYRNRVLIFSDEHTQMRNILQNLIGSKFIVS